jgi:hypothetical protein
MSNSNNYKLYSGLEKNNEFIYGLYNGSKKK